MGQIRKSKGNRTQLVKKLDAVFSQWIRQRGSKDGMNVCFTCGRTQSIAKLQAGHFQSRGKFSTRWDERNVQAQCVGCNLYNQGQQFIFGKRLDQEYGSGTSEYIYLQSQKTHKYTNDDLKSMIERYSEAMRH
jgi:hypothetical protein